MYTVLFGFDRASRVFGFAIVSKGLFQASAGDLQFFYGVCYGIEETAASIADELESWELYVSG